MAITASAQPESGRIVYARSNFPHQFRLFPKMAGIILRKTDPGLIWMAWSGFGQTHLVWKQAGVQESSGPGFWQDSTGPLPVSHFQTRFRSSTSDLVLSDYVRCWPNGSGPEASRCARIIRPASAQCFRVDPDRMRMGFGTLTGDTCIHSTEGFCSHMSTKEMEMEIGV